MTRLDDRGARACARAVAALAPGVGIHDIVTATALVDWDELLARVSRAGRIDADTVRTALLDALAELVADKPWLRSTAA